MACLSKSAGASTSQSYVSLANSCTGLFVHGVHGKRYFFNTDNLGNIVGLNHVAERHHTLGIYDDGRVIFYTDDRGKSCLNLIK